MQVNTEHCELRWSARQERSRREGVRNARKWGMKLMTELWFPRRLTVWLFYDSQAFLAVRISVRKLKLEAADRKQKSYIARDSFLSCTFAFRGAMLSLIQVRRYKKTNTFTFLYPLSRGSNFWYLLRIFWLVKTEMISENGRHVHVESFFTFTYRHKVVRAIKKP